jgi:hypothetical protein
VGEAGDAAWDEVQMLRLNMEAQAQAIHGMEQARVLGEELLQAKVQIAELAAEVKNTAEALHSIIQSKDALLQAQETTIRLLHADIARLNAGCAGSGAAPQPAPAPAAAPGIAPTPAMGAPAAAPAAAAVAYGPMAGFMTLRAQSTIPSPASLFFPYCLKTSTSSASVGGESPVKLSVTPLSGSFTVYVLGIYNP